MRSRLTAALVAALGLWAMTLGPAWAAWTAGTNNSGNNFTAAASFPTYPNEVTSNSAWGYYREEEAASAATTSTAADSSGNNRPGTYDGPTNGPTTYWRFDENTGTTAYDSSGTVNIGTLVNAPGWSSGEVKNAVTLNGTNQYVNGTRAAVRTDTSFSVAAWVYLTSKTSYATAVSQDGANISGFFLQYSQGLDRWAFVIRTSDSTTAGLDSASGSASPSPNTWYHLVGVYDSSAGQIKLYVNGALQATVAHTTVWNASGMLAAGRAKFGGNTDFWPGMIDDVRVYQRALSASEVTTLANGLPLTDWEFSEGAGSTTADRGTGNNSGGLTGGATWTTSGHSGNAVSFDGSTGRVVSSAAVVTTNTSFSVAAWVYLTAKSVNRTAVSQDGTTISGFYLQYEATNDRWAFTMHSSDSTGASNTWALGTTSPTLNTWYHLVGVYDSTSGQIKLYVNGSLRATTAFTTPWNATGKLAVGRGFWNFANTDFWPGMIDSVKVYQRALGSTEVANIYNGTDLSPADFTAGVTGALQGPQQGLQSATSVAFAGTNNAYSNTSLAAPTTFTVECWFRTGNSAGGLIVGFGDTATGPDATFDRQIYVDSGGKLTFGTWPSTSPLYIRSPNAYNDGAWHYVAGSFGAAGLKLYADGSLVASDPTITTAGSYTGYWRWGGGNVAFWPNQPSSGYLIGTIDEVAVYPTQLTDQQIAEHYNANH